MRKIRYAVVGAGWISQEAFLPAVPAAVNSETVALVSGSPDTSAKLAAFHHIAQTVDYAGYDRLLAGEHIDAVYIALPNSMHADFAMRALRAGKHVMVEKPLATTLAESEAMIAAARASGAYLMTAYRLHFEPATCAMLGAVAAGDIGQPHYVSATFSFQTQMGNHRLQAGHWGGPLQDVGVYCVNAVRHIFAAEPIAVQANAMRPAGDARFSQVDQGLAATIHFGAGRIAQVFCSFGTALSESIRILGSAGEIVLDPAFRFESALHMTLRNAAGTLIKQFDHVDHFAGQIAYFSDCILHQSPPAPDGEEGLADMRVLLAIEKAAKTGETELLAPRAYVARNWNTMARAFPRTQHRLLV